MKLLLILEALFFGLSSALTTGLLFVYLVSIGAGVAGISIVVGISALTKLATQLLLYKYPRFLLTKVKLNFIVNYGLDRILLIFIPRTQDYLMIAVAYAIAAATPTSTGGTAPMARSTSTVTGSEPRVGSPSFSKGTGER